MTSAVSARRSPRTAHQRPTGWDTLAESFINHLVMADHRNMSFKASKTVFGAPKMEFFGYVLDKSGKRHADHHLVPLRQMVALSVPVKQGPAGG